MYQVFCFLFFALNVLAVENEWNGKAYLYYQSGISKNLNRQGLGTEFTLSSRLNSFVRTKFSTLGEHESVMSSESYLEVTEGYIEWQWSLLKLRAGWQTINWEGTDVLNLFDVVNSKNYVYPLSAISRSSPSLRYIQEYENFEFDLIYIPTKTKNRYPPNESYWLPRNKNIVLENQNTEIRIPENVDYLVKDTEIVDQADQNNWATRWSYRGEWFDASIFGYEGVNSSATLFLEAVPLDISNRTVLQLESPITIRPLDYRQRVYGGLFTKTLFDTWIVRISSSSTKTIQTDERLPKDQNASVASLEKSLTVFSKPLIVSLAYYEINKVDQFNLAVLRSVFTRAHSFSGRLEISDNLSALWSYIYDSVGLSSLFHLELDYRLNNSLSVGVSTDQLNGEEKTLLGTYDNFDFYRGRLNFSF